MLIDEYNFPNDFLCMNNVTYVSAESPLIWRRFVLLDSRAGFLPVRSCYLVQKIKRCFVLM